ncbi:hypothetical protein [Chitinibacter tainanensis]|uniref:hypothetical protein n=2 Tax=Chitinibacter TaxID=230666 RepID=UPI002356E556|nr:hypothetical protein [Chitinibacter tainanensis]
MVKTYNPRAGCMLAYSCDQRLEPNTSMSQKPTFPALIMLLLAATALVFYWDAWSAWQSNSMVGRCSSLHPGGVCTQAAAVGAWLFAGGSPAQGYAVLLAGLASGLMGIVILLWRLGAHRQGRSQ